MNAYQNVNEIRIFYVGSYVIMNALMIVLIYLVNQKQVQKRMEQEENLKKWMPLILAQESKTGQSSEKMKEIEKYTAWFDRTSGADKKIEIPFDESIRETLRSLGVLEEENPNEKRIRTIQAVFSISLNFISVTLSVVMLMINPFFCYLIFSVKFILDAVCRQTAETFMRYDAKEQKSLHAMTLQERVGLLKKEQEQREQKRRAYEERMREEREHARKERERARKEREHARMKKGNSGN